MLYKHKGLIEMNKLQIRMSYSKQQQKNEELVVVRCKGSGFYPSIFKVGFLWLYTLTINYPFTQH